MSADDYLNTLIGAAKDDPALASSLSSKKKQLPKEEDYIDKEFGKVDDPKLRDYIRKFRFRSKDFQRQLALATYGGLLWFPEFKTNPSKIKNKEIRRSVFEEQKIVKQLAHERRRIARKLGILPKIKPITQEDKREFDPTFVVPGDEEVELEESYDEFASYFLEGKDPRIVITTSIAPSKRMLALARDLLCMFPGARYYKRRHFKVRDIVRFCTERKFTDIIMVRRGFAGRIDGLIHIHLPEGPTATYRLSNYKPSTWDTRQYWSRHRPELILNNFSTRLGQRIGRMFSCLVPHDPEFRGRRVITFHNQRDFIFVRHHRYEFESKKIVNLAEIGPRFTLRLETLQLGTFDRKFGEYEWFHTKHMDTSRLRFFL